MGELLTLLWRLLIGFATAFIRLIWKPSTKSIHGEVALVTGAGHGMGRLYCTKLSQLGATIVAVDVNESANAETLRILTQKGAKAYAYTVDLRNQTEIHKLAAEIREDVGDVTMLVNNAGIIYPTDILSLTEEMITNTFKVNVLSHFWLIKQFLPNMKTKNHGHIVAMASYAGLFGTAYLTDYSSSKYAVLGLMESLRHELRRQKLDGIKLTCICPSFVSTGMVSNPRARGNVPVLEPEYVVDQAVQAVLRNECLISLPSVTVLKALTAILPDSVIDAANDYVGAKVDLIEQESNAQMNGNERATSVRIE